MTYIFKILSLKHQENEVGGLKKLNTYIKHSLVSFPYLTKTEKCLECNYVQVSLANIFA